MHWMHGQTVLWRKWVCSLWKLGVKVVACLAPRIQYFSRLSPETAYASALQRVNFSWKVSTCPSCGKVWSCEFTFHQVPFLRHSNAWPISCATTARTCRSRWRLDSVIGPLFQGNGVVFLGCSSLWPTGKTPASQVSWFHRRLQSSTTSRLVRWRLWRCLKALDPMKVGDRSAKACKAPFLLCFSYIYNYDYEILYIIYYVFFPCM